MESSEYQNDWLTAGNVLPLTDPALVEDISKRLTTNAAVMQKETDAEKECFGWICFHCGFSS